LRLAIYTDYTYRRDGDRIYAERAFALFLGRLSEELGGVTIVGKVSPAPGKTRYPLSPTAGFVELPYYASLGRPLEASIAMARSLAVFWRLLGQVDGIWLLGPHPLGYCIALLARLRGRGVVLGVRQDFQEYVRARHPGKRWLHVLGDAMEAAWRWLGARTATVAVGPVLAAQYRGPRTLAISVSLVTEAEIAPADLALERSYDGERRVLSVGRLETEKNPLLLAEIVARLVASGGGGGGGGDRDGDGDDGDHGDWRLLVCGEGPLSEPLAARCAELGVADRVELLGYVDHDRLHSLYRSSHALLHVSWTEGVPQILFEAFAARLPVVATAVGGVPDTAGGAAVLIGPGDAGAASAALARVCRDPELRTRLTEEGVRIVRGATLDGEARRVAAFLRSVIEPWPMPAPRRPGGP
jgi:glycosyltransferase involved in cell wall biosynthesis